MSVFDGCLQQILFPWNALVCCSVCSQWLLLTLTWFDTSSENRVSGATELRCSSRVFASIALQIVWMIGSNRCSSLDRCFGCETCETQNSKPKRTEQSLELLSQFSVDKVNASILDGPSVSFHKKIGGSATPRMIVSSVRPSAQSVKFISNCKEWRQASATWSQLGPGVLLWIDIHPHVSDIQDPGRRFDFSIREMSMWVMRVSITQSQSSAASLISSTLRSFWRFSPIVGCRFLCLAPGKRQWVNGVKLFPCPACWFPWDGPWPWSCWSLGICWVWMVGYVWMVVEIVRFLSMWASLMNWESICHLNPHETKFQVEAVSMETMTHNAVITACELPSCKTEVKRRPRLCVAAWQSSLAN